MGDALFALLGRGIDEEDEEYELARVGSYVLAELVDVARLFVKLNTKA